MPIPDPSTIDTTKTYVMKGSTLKDMVVKLTSLWVMTNNNPNGLNLRTYNVCLGNVVQKADFISTQPRAGL